MNSKSSTLSRSSKSSAQKTSTRPTATSPSEPSTTQRTGRYLFVGIILTVFNFSFYTIIARIINDNNYLWLATLISTVATTILAFFLHSKITWKERPPTKLNVIKFFIWNALGAFAIGPFFTWLVTLATPLYDFAFNISSTLHLPFDYEFIQSTGVFVIVSLIILVLNYLFYDKFVFSESQKRENGI